MHGYCGKILKIDLSSGISCVEELDEAKARKFLGGRGFGADVLFNEVPKGADALGPENRIVFAAGPLAGTYAPGSGRLAVMGKSPQTGVFGEAYTGGFLAHEMKYAGYDAVVVHGKAAGKVYVQIKDGATEIRDASQLSGMGPEELETTIKEELGDEDYKIASCGLAGENGIRFACVMNDTDRAAGRTGLGAIMGSKNLKAIAVRGTGSVGVSDPQAFRDFVLSDMAQVKLGAFSGILSELGTGGATEMMDAWGHLPTRNWESGTFEHAAKIGGTAMQNSILVGRRACQACPIGCTRIVEVKNGPFAGVRPEYGGPEDEAVAAFGSLCGNKNVEAIALANQNCNIYGMDVISAGSAIAFAMDCFERGILTEKDAGFKITWGDPEVVIKLVDLMAKREGIGDLLAEGTAGAARKLGGEAPKLAVEVKGLELGMHDSRGKKSLGLSYATSPRGATHCEGMSDNFLEGGAPDLGVDPITDPYTLEGKPASAVKVENYISFGNSIPVCAFMNYALGVPNTKETTGMIASATGWKDLTLAEELVIGDRNHNLARAFTVRESNGKADDRLPHKMSKALPDGAAKGHNISPKELSKALKEYYGVRGWDENGVPTKEKLEELGLEDEAKKLHGKGGSK